MLYEPLAIIVEEIQNKSTRCGYHKSRRLKRRREEDEESYPKPEDLDDEERFRLDDNYIKGLNALVRKAKHNLEEEVLNFIKHPYIDHSLWNPDNPIIQRIFFSEGTDLHKIYLAFDKRIPKYRIKMAVKSLIDQGLVEWALKKTEFGEMYFLVPTKR